MDFAATRTAEQDEVYAHVEARDLEPDAVGIGEIEKLGAATLAKIKDWVGHHQVVIQPVLNMHRT